tara:strand:+ start:2596 stop:3069 length:474 start_codon:yes stop_codon:yes gene_type:complete
MMKQATIEDFRSLQNLYRNHAEEAKLKGKLDFDVETAMQVTRKKLIENTSNILIYRKDGNAVGYAVISLSEMTWNEIGVGIIEVFYIHPEYRHKRSSHKFLDQIEDYLRDHDIELMFGGVFMFDTDYNVDEDYVNRASKYFEMKGMKWCGNMYVKEL